MQSASEAKGELHVAIPCLQRASELQERTAIKGHNLCHAQLDQLSNSVPLFHELSPRSRRRSRPVSGFQIATKFSESFSVSKKGVRTILRIFRLLSRVIPNKLL